uniref:Uncharacterized protein n=1 Tax=Moniliophthora roreri TaxID=221103 RepID=A0A0W0F8W4_MONRR
MLLLPSDLLHPSHRRTIV